MQKSVAASDCSTDFIRKVAYLLAIVVFALMIVSLAFMAEGGKTMSLTPTLVLTLCFLLFTTLTIFLRKDRIVMVICLVCAIYFLLLTVQDYQYYNRFHRYMSKDVSLYGDDR